MVMEFIDGVSLRDRLQQVHADGLTLRTDTVLSIVQQVGAALTYAHQHGYVHRDVKPGNIMLARNGRVYLTDFGVVKLLDTAQGTLTGAVIGTPEYMSPEQAAGAPVGPPADLYALAIVAYEMLVGRAPFQAPTPVAVLHKHLHEPPPPPTSLAPWCPPELDAVFSRALAKHPHERFPNAGEFIQALTAALHRPPGAHPAPPATTISGVPTLATTPYPGQPAPSAYGAPPTATGATIPSAGVTPAGAAMTPTGAGMTPGGVNMTPIGAGMTPPGGGPPLAPPPGATPVPPSSGRGRVPIVGAALIAIILLLGAGAAFALTRGGDDDDDALGAGDTATATSAVLAESATETPAPPAPTATTPAEPTATAEIVAPATPTEGQSESTATLGAVDPTATGTVPVAADQPVIFFSSHRGDIHDSQIYVMALDGSEQRKVVEARGHSWGPRVSPDGTMMFFSSVARGEHESHDAAGGGTTGSGNHDIYVNDLTGSTAADLVVTLRANVTAGQTTWDNGWDWTPDSSMITFATDRDGNWDIYLMAPDGSGVTRLTDDPAQDGWPSWTPDGEHIVFSSDRTGNWEIFIMDADGSDVRQLTYRRDTVDLFPDVSPDGAWIAFSSQVSVVNEGEIYIMPIDGGEPTRLTTSAALNNMPSWCPGGEQIVFTSDRDGNENIYLINRDGSGLVQLTDDPGEDTTPVCVLVNPD
jgi:serine/threonine-protein kinase